MSKIKPCPFCGALLENTPPSKVFYHVNNGCILSTRNFIIDDIEKWNERKPIERILERLEEKENEAILKAPITSNLFDPAYQKWMMKSYGFKESIAVVKEEGGIK